MAGNEYGNTDVTSLEERKEALTRSGLNLIRLLASGAFAEVYEVESVDEPRVRLAAKIYYELEWDRRIRHAQREFDTVKNLQHPNILQMFELVVTDDTIFSTMELMGGGELLDHMRPGIGLSIDMGRSIMEDICHGLMFLHEETALVHLDLKPENILLSADGRAKLADFDAALPEGTRVAVVRGTAECHPPEYHNQPTSEDGHIIRRQADTWALGLILYGVLVGAYAWDFPDMSDSGWVAFKTTPTLSAPWALFPDRLMSIFQALFTETPSERAEAVDVLTYVVTAFESDANSFRPDEVQEVTEVDDDGSSTTGSVGSRSSRSDFGLTQLLTAAWKPELNTSEKWVVLVEPQELSTYDCFIVVCIPPQEHEKFGRVVCRERYSRLLALHRLCTGLHPKDTPRRFPQKRVFRNRAPDFLQQRAAALSDYFEEAFAIIDCLEFYLDCVEFHVVTGDLRDPLFHELERSFPTIYEPVEFDLPRPGGLEGIAEDIEEGHEDDDGADAQRIATTSRVKRGSLSGIQMTPLDVDGFLRCSLENDPISSFPKWLVGYEKNRFPRVMPRWLTRVELVLETVSPAEDVQFEKQTYINANFVDGTVEDRPPAYIATQSPLDCTREDFWKMVWQQRVTVIVGLTTEGEAQYFSRTAETTFGAFRVICLSHHDNEHFVTTELKLSHSTEDREWSLWHYEFSSWPANSVPTTPDSRADPIGVLYLVKAVRERVSTVSVDHPIVVHCDTGVGRTGAYILIDSAITALERCQRVDLLEILRHIRKFRMSLVDRPALYKFAWQAVVSAIRSRVLGTENRIFTLGSTISHELNAILRRASLSSVASYDMARVGDDTAFELRSDTKAVEILPRDTALLLHRPAKEKRKTGDVFTSADIGERVTVSGYDCFGTLRFVGSHPVHHTPRVGIELDAKLSNMNGTLHGHQFFECPEGHGVLCIPAKVTRVHGSRTPRKRPQVTLKDVENTVHVNGKGPAKMVYLRAADEKAGIEELCGVVFSKPIGDTDGSLDGERLFECEPNCGLFVAPKSVRRLTVTSDDLGRLVTVRGYDSIGILRFFGPHSEKGMTRCGVELDHPIGKNDGTVNDVEYFTCKQDHGILCAPGKVRLYYADVKGPRVSTRASASRKSGGNK